MSPVSNDSEAAFRLIVRKATGGASVAAITVARARLGYARPPYSIRSGTRRSMPSGSGRALRNPDAAPALVRSGTLQMAPLAWNAGNPVLLPSGCTVASVRGWFRHGDD